MEKEYDVACPICHQKTLEYNDELLIDVGTIKVRVYCRNCKKSFWIMIEKEE